MLVVIIFSPKFRSPVHQLTDACNVKWQVKSDSCLSFQTAKRTGDLPVWLASMLNSSFQLHSAAWITTMAATRTDPEEQSPGSACS